MRNVQKLTPKQREIIELLNDGFDAQLIRDICECGGWNQKHVLVIDKEYWWLQEKMRLSTFHNMEKMGIVKMTHNGTVRYELTEEYVRKT